MADKKKLDDMLAQGTSRPVIRRGQGIRLSTDLPGVEDTATVGGTESAQAHDLESARSRKRTSAQGDEPERVTRVSQGQRLRVDLVKQLKRIALEDERKLYEVMEEAIEQYLERRKQGER